MRILIIDDTQADHDIAVEYLTEMGGEYEFFHAYTACEGLEIYRTQPIDVVLLDYRMPDKNGLEVLREFSLEHKQVPVIMMTGEGNEFVAVTAMKLGSQDYLPKRVLTASSLKRAVERVVEHTDMMRKMENYRTDLERSNHDLEQFANIVAHDLKSPLRAITQHLTLIRNRNQSLLDDKSKRSLEFAVEGSERMRALIDALFEYAHLGFGEPHFETVSLEMVMENLRRDLSALIEESGARITYEALPQVVGDPVLLTQLLQNLICNAIKFCKVRPQIHVNAVRENDQWNICVQDNGIGIDPSQYEHIFAIFRRLHQTGDYPGIGLGLAICARIAKQHGGKIGVESTLGKGSRFYITLPVRQLMAMPAKEAACA